MRTLQRWLELGGMFCYEETTCSGSGAPRKFRPLYRRQAATFAQVEYCDNLVFRRRAALDNLGRRLLDAHRTIGQPNKITVIFGRKVSKQYRCELQTEIEDTTCPTRDSQPLSQRLHQAVRSRSPHPADAGSEQQRQRLRRQESRRKSTCPAKISIGDQRNCLNVQQDILETFVDRG
jgi:hypothetical protein